MAELVGSQVGNYTPNPFSDKTYKYKCNYADGGSIYTNSLPCPPDNSPAANFEGGATVYSNIRRPDTKLAGVNTSTALARPRRSPSVYARPLSPVLTSPRREMVRGMRSKTRMLNFEVAPKRPQ